MLDINRATTILTQGGTLSKAYSMIVIGYSKQTFDADHISTNVKSSPLTNHDGSLTITQNPDINYTNEGSPSEPQAIIIYFDLALTEQFMNLFFDKNFFNQPGHENILTFPIILTANGTHLDSTQSLKVTLLSPCPSFFLIPNTKSFTMDEIDRAQSYPGDFDSSAVKIPSVFLLLIEGFTKPTLDKLLNTVSIVTAQDVTADDNVAHPIGSRVAFWGQNTTIGNENESTACIPLDVVFYKDKLNDLTSPVTGTLQYKYQLAWDANNPTTLSYTVTTTIPNATITILPKQ